MRIPIAEANALLTEALAGEIVDHVSLGDSWQLRFSNDLWLVAQEMASAEEPGLNELLSAAEPPVLGGVDAEQVAQSVVLVSNMRRPVTRINIEEDGRLTLVFGGNRRIEFPTQTDIVDWQWSLGPSPRGPYNDHFIVACLWRGEVEVPEPESAEL